MRMDVGDAADFPLFLCPTCNAPLLPSLVESHRATCSRNTKQQVSRTHSLVTVLPSAGIPAATTDDNCCVEATPLLLYVGSEGILDERSLAVPSSRPPNRSAIPMQEQPVRRPGDASVLYASIHSPPSPCALAPPSSVPHHREDDECSALSATRRPSPSSVDEEGDDSVRCRLDYPSAVGDETDGGRLQEYPTGWGPVLQEMPSAGERLASSSPPRSPPPSDRESRADISSVAEAPPRLFDAFDRAYFTPTFRAAEAVVAHRTHSGNPTARRDPVFLPYLHNGQRHGGAPRPQPLQHPKPFMITGGVVPRGTWGSDRPHQGTIVKRAESAGHLRGRGVEARGFKPVAPRLASSGQTPLRVSNPAVAAQSDGRNEPQSAAEADKRSRPIMVRGAGGSGARVVINRPAVLLSPRRKAASDKRPSMETRVVDAASELWVARDVRLVPPVATKTPRPEPTATTTRAASAGSRFVFPPSLRAFHPAVTTRTRPSSVGPQTQARQRASPASTSPDPTEPPGR